MITRYLLAALGAGLLAGLLLTPIQYARIVPLILHAETYEDGGAPHEHASVPGLVGTAQAGTLDDAPLLLAHSTAPGEAHEEAEAPALVESRLLGTVLANLVTGSGFALILAAVGLVAGRPITAANGLVWGALGFGVVSLAPSLGLAPELPAMPAAELADRQLWWISTVALSALGAGLLILGRKPLLKVLGVLALVLPQLYGAPQPADLTSPVPPTLAAEFAVASLATSLAFWLILGLALGVLFDRLKRDAGPAAALA
ncbi:MULTISPECIES: CbtA family protein [unclassified Aureimonas]|uniref:CbtA family protein n=1 Tax=unclassified Aureimonas TaxID=2615206 RepID=UPI0006F827EF|nr:MULTISPECIES: CbtA family protein [unclassified Aureimonas]KQT64122.1 hypothetical protein ASG62_03725 [Aureimonas sp. Leaf427]KQT81311.1 hypothetical protein ASG54_00995 [Aureimonas sp. Leaf460]